MGDFNCNLEHFVTKRELFNDAHWLDAGKHENRLTWDARHPLNTSGFHRFSPSQRCDYIMLKRDDKHIQNITLSTCVESYSDHHSLLLGMYLH